MTELSTNISFSENWCLRMGLSCHNTTPRSIFEAKPHHHKPSLDWKAYSEDSQLEVMKSKGSQESQCWGLNGEKPTKREKGRKTVDVQPFTLKIKLLSANFLSTGAQWQLEETSIRKNHITHLWGSSSGQEYQRECTASDMLDKKIGDRSRKLGSWTSKVRAAKPGIRLRTRAEEWQEDWSALRMGLNSNIHLFRKPFYFLLIMGCNYIPKLISQNKTQQMDTNQEGNKKRQWSNSGQSDRSRIQQPPTHIHWQAHQTLSFRLFYYFLENLIPCLFPHQHFYYVFTPNL